MLLPCYFIYLFITELFIKYKIDRATEKVS